MQRIDYRRVFHEVYAPATTGPHQVRLPPLSLLSLPGAPLDSPQFAAAATTLRACDRALRHHIAHGPMAIRFAPMPLELHHDGERGYWLCLMQPPVVTPERLTASCPATPPQLRPLPEAWAFQQRFDTPVPLATALHQLTAAAQAEGLQPLPGYQLILFNVQGQGEGRRRTLLRLRLS